MPKTDPLLRTIQAGLLGWLLPGAGHFYLGLRGLAWVFFLAIGGSYLVGMLIGGVKTSVDPIGNFWLFVAEMGVGGLTSIFYLAAWALPTVPVWQPSPYVSYFPGQDLAQIYLSVAGLMNIMAALDAIARAQTDGLPVFHHEKLMADRVRDAAEAAAKPASVAATPQPEMKP